MPFFEQWKDEVNNNSLAHGKMWGIIRYCVFNATGRVTFPSIDPKPVAVTTWSILIIITLMLFSGACTGEKLVFLSIELDFRQCKIFVWDYKNLETSQRGDRWQVAACTNDHCLGHHDLALLYCRESVKTWESAESGFETSLIQIHDGGRVTFYTNNVERCIFTTPVNKKQSQ